MIRGFDPDFDDAVWTLDWLREPVVQVPVGEYEGGYRVEQEFIEDIGVFGQMYHLDPPLDVRGLFAPDGTLWMSDTPQERMMMTHNAGRTWGHVLVGGMGLGLYPQYCQSAESFTIVEQSPVVLRLVAPLLQEVMDQRGIPLKLVVGSIEDYLTKSEPGQFDTIFLDTWPRLDAALLPVVNWLRDESIRHLTPDGQILLWGYRWMVRMFEEASATLLRMDPGERESYLAQQVSEAPLAAAMLQPVAEGFRGQVIQRWELDQAVAECREWVMGAKVPPQV